MNKHLRLSNAVGMHAVKSDTVDMRMRDTVRLASLEKQSVQSPKIWLVRGLVKFVSDVV